MELDDNRDQIYKIEPFAAQRCSKPTIRIVASKFVKAQLKNYKQWTSEVLTLLKYAK